MPPSTDQPPRDMQQLRRWVGRRMRFGASLDSIEEQVIDKCDWLNDEQKSALWLYAWSYVPHRQQRRHAQALLILSGAPPELDDEEEEPDG